MASAKAPICAWESDRVTPSAKHYGPLAALFGIAISDLLEVGPTPGSLPAVMPLVPANNLALLLQEELVKAQRETIALQKQRIEHLEAEGQQLRVRLTELEKLGSVTLVIITSLMNFISIPLEYISELIVAW